MIVLDGMQGGTAATQDVFIEHVGIPTLPGGADRHGRAPGARHAPQGAADRLRRDPHRRRRRQGARARRRRRLDRHGRADRDGRQQPRARRRVPQDRERGRLLRRLAGRAATRRGSRRRTTSSPRASTPSSAGAGSPTTSASSRSRRRRSRGPAASPTSTTSSRRTSSRSRSRPPRWPASRSPAPTGSRRERIGLGSGADVVPAPVPQLRAARRQRVLLRRRGHRAAPAVALAARADLLPLLPAQRRGRAARVVVPPARLRGLVPGRARHPHERGPERRSSSRRAPPARRARRRPRSPTRRRLRGSPAATRADRPERGASSPSGGSRIGAFRGDSIGSALYASGQRVFSRSFKYHRPRGLLCCSGDCPNCMMTVDGVPNVRVCAEPVRHGAWSSRRTSWARSITTCSRSRTRSAGPSRRSASTTGR